MKFFKNLFNKLNQRYKTFTSSQRLIFSLVIFVLFFLMVSDPLMFNNINQYKALKSEATTLEVKMKELNTQLEQHAKNPMNDTLKPLLERKNILRKEVFELKNMAISSIDNSQMLDFIEKTIVFSPNLKLASFKNVGSEPQIEGLQKHNFNLQIETKDYSAFYDFISKLEVYANINNLSINRTEQGLTGNIDFFIFSNSNSLLDIANIKSTKYNTTN